MLQEHIDEILLYLNYKDTISTLSTYRYLRLRNNEALWRNKAIAKYGISLDRIREEDIALFITFCSRDDKNKKWHNMLLTTATTSSAKYIMIEYTCEYAINIYVYTTHIPSITDIFVHYHYNVSFDFISKLRDMPGGEKLGIWDFAALVPTALGDSVMVLIWRYKNIYAHPYITELVNNTIFKYGISWHTKNPIKLQQWASDLLKSNDRSHQIRMLLYQYDYEKVLYILENQIETFTFSPDVLDVIESITDEQYELYKDIIDSIKKIAIEYKDD